MHPALPAPVGFATDNPTIDAIFVGAFEDRKSPVETAEAFAALSQENPGFRFLMVGKGAAQERITELTSARSQIELKIDPPRQGVIEAIRSARVLVLASRDTDRWREQVGLPITEALSEGLTIVTTRSTGLSSWLENTGHVVVDDPVTVEALTAGIRRAISRPLDRASVRSSLPESDARKEADQWLFSIAY
ncbi:hypothetical protein AYL44_10695 [Microbacterium oleivorans]|uniref:D-inositol 3-phosphate glycosyltransferase n=1 Tax=Microbacterium oleivorans TaxID=273677 RepID=A0A177K7F5_9MICO|nr:hypothetical protein AYL44_10695 [Microbacterium oleivorans]